MFLEEFNIDLVDSGLIRDKFAGSYILTDSGETAIIEVSTTHAVPNILKRLRDLDITLDSVKYIIVTHIHLDHAGGAGALISKLPNAKLIVHPSGLKHMVDPTKLIAGANAVYGESVVKNDYGNIIPIPEERVLSCMDNQVFTLGHRELTTLFTPGHARHHISIYDNFSKGIFTGDSFGLTYPELDVNGRKFYQPTTTPTAFEYDKMLESLELMMQLEPEHLFFTHYSYTTDVNDAYNQIKKRLVDYVNMVKDTPVNLEETLKQYYIKECKEFGVKLQEQKIEELFNIDIKLNAMGLLFWKNRDKT